MSNQEDAFEYDDDEAVIFIKKHLPQDVAEKTSDDQVNYIIDIMYEFYEDKGFMGSDDSDDTVEVLEDEMIEYVYATVAKDRVFEIAKEEVSLIIQGEFAYCESLGLFE